MSMNIEQSERETFLERLRRWSESNPEVEIRESPFPLTSQGLLNINYSTSHYTVRCLEKRVIVCPKCLLAFMIQVEIGIKRTMPKSDCCNEVYRIFSEKEFHSLDNWRRDEYKMPDDMFHGVRKKLDEYYQKFGYRQLLDLEISLTEEAYDRMNREYQQRTPVFGTSPFTTRNYGVYSRDIDRIWGMNLLINTHQLAPIEIIEARSNSF
ncbi:hypothetical protein KLEB273_gp071 [Bacillus phage vB_BauM_KLEB27-3]|nr:hypothetical protein KLEB273_gp071 [Bacillus phage vB_BauM_KLEB27-3]